MQVDKVPIVYDIATTTLYTLYTTSYYSTEGMILPSLSGHVALE